MAVTDDTNPNYPIIHSLPDPFPQLGVTLSDSDLRETAYEILTGVWRSSGGSRKLTYVSERKGPAPALQRSMTWTTASTVKKALGLKSLSSNSVCRGESGKRVRELMRVQMRISEQIDSRVRRGFLRIAAGQLVGWRIEAQVLPLELLQQLTSLDFPTRREYEAWQKRNLKVLEAGLLHHPHLTLEKNNIVSQQLRQFVHDALHNPVETGKHSEAMLVLRGIVMSLACQSLEDESVSDISHWADGFPLNLWLYRILLEACFDVNEATYVIEEVDEVIEFIKKTWVILGISQALHNLCFLWVLLHQYVATGELENDLLFAADNMLLEVGKDAKATKDPAYCKILSSTLNSILCWAKRKLSGYHDIFYTGNINIMQSVLSLGLSTILVEDISHEYHRKRKEVDIVRGRVDSYIRSSVRNAFYQEREKIYLSRYSDRLQNNQLPVLSILAQEISYLAFHEKEVYSPILKKWHPLATGVAVATLHACFGNELKLFVSGNSELTLDSIQVLIAADKLEKKLVQLAVEDSMNSEDGGTSIIQEMTPYEAEGSIANLVKSWIRMRIERLWQRISIYLQQEVWNPQANKERYAPSALEVMRVVDGILDAFFLLPIPTHHLLLPELMSGLDRCIQHYIFSAKSECGKHLHRLPFLSVNLFPETYHLLLSAVSRSDFLPTMPTLTRCSVGSKVSGVFKKKVKLAQGKKPQVETTNEDDITGTSQLVVRINSLHLIRKGLEALEKKTITQLRSVGSTHLDNSLRKMLESSRTTCLEGVQQLCVTIAYKVIFHDLHHFYLDGLYLMEVSSSRIEIFLLELEKYLEFISSTAHDRIRTRLITDIMKASFEGFLLVLLAGGPSRAFTTQDSAILEEDFKHLTDLFWSCGDGLPVDLIDKFAFTVKDVLPLFRIDTESLIDQFRCSMFDEYGRSAKPRLPLPPTSGQWNPTDPNTMLRVLCYRNDKLASSFLKKTYNLPKKL